MKTNLIIALVLGASACGQKDKADPAATPGADGGLSAPGATVTAAATAPSAGLQLSLMPASKAAAAGLSLTDPTSHTGQASATEIKSLKYFLTGISICKNATLSGSGFSGASDCISLFTGKKISQAFYQAFDRVEAAKPEYDADYRDLMQGLKLAAKIRKSDAGSYRYAIVNWMQPIKVTAELKLNDGAGTVIYSHAGTDVSVTDQNGLAHLDTVVADMTVGPATEAITSIGNGGSVFAFGAPLTISEADVDAGAQFAIDMVFNPDAMVKGADAPFAQAVFHGIDAGGARNGLAMSVPALTLIPLVHKATERVVRETYLAHMTAGQVGIAGDADAQPLPIASPFDVRFELFYLKDSVETDLSEMINGAHSELLYTSETVAPPMGVSNVVSLGRDPVTKAYSFYSWQGLTAPALISDLSRLATVGDKGTARMNCGQSGIAMSEGGCYSAATNAYHAIGFDVGYELVSRELLRTANSDGVVTVEAADSQDGSGSGSGSEDGSGSQGGSGSN